MIYLKLFLSFFKIGAFTFGGGYAMLPLIQQEVLKNGWLTQEEIINFIAISESTPGPFAVNMSTYVGCQTAGIVGGLCATVGVVLPSFIIILLVAKVYEKFMQSKIVKGAMIGLRGVVVGLIGAAVITTTKATFIVSTPFLIDAKLISGFVVFSIAIVALMKKIHPIMIIIGSAMVGMILMSYL